MTAYQNYYENEILSFMRFAIQINQIIFFTSVTVRLDLSILIHNVIPIVYYIFVIHDKSFMSKENTPIDKNNGKTDTYYNRPMQKYGRITKNIVML